MEAIYRRRESRESRKRLERSFDYGEVRGQGVSKEMVRRMIFEKGNLDILGRNLVTQTSVTVSIVNLMICFCKKHFTRKELDDLFDELYDRDFFKQFSELVVKLKDDHIPFILEL